MSKDEKRSIILDYARRKYYTERRFVSKREIRRVFHVELYNYFENIFDLYQKIDVDVPLCFCQKDYARKKIVRYIQEKSKEKIYPLKNEIEKELKIHIFTYFRNLESLYKKAKVDFSLYRLRRESIEHPVYTKEQINQKRKLIAELIQKEYKDGRYVSVPEIQRLLNLKFDLYFCNIKEAYRIAKVRYQRPCPTILGKNKETVLTKVVIELFKRMGYRIERVSIFDKKDPNKFEDLKIINKDGVIYLVELKAYRKEQRISGREISQLMKYLYEQKIENGLFVTTSETILSKKNSLILVDGVKLKSLLKEYDLECHLKKIEWIQNAKVDLKENLKIKKIKRKEIIEFIAGFDGTPTVKIIEQNLGLDMRTYFDRPFGELIKKIKINSDNGGVCMDHQL